MMGVMFEAYLQNQIEGMIRQRAMTSASVFDVGAQAKSGTLPVEGGTLDEAPIPAIVENAQED